MEFKIDTKPTYSVVTPQSNLIDANLTEAIRQKWKELTGSGSPNLIIDLHMCQSADPETVHTLEALHQDIYDNRGSLVLTAVPESCLAVLKEKELDERLNLTRTLEEAVDIVSMEILERDLFDEAS